MAFRNVPEKKYRLHDGSLGTEYEAVLEAIKHWKAKQQEVEDKLEELQRQLALADGHP
jgi:hypothetical protein